MPSNPEPPPLAARLRRFAWLVLALGLAAAALIYAFAGPDAADVLGDTRLNDYNIERIGGKAAVYAARFNRWLGGLWHGRPLAATVAVLALAVALACLWVAHLAALPVHDDADDDGDARL